MKLRTCVLLLVNLLIAPRLWSTEALGKIFYKKGPNGDLVYRDMTLEVPTRGQGKVVLRSQNSDFTITSHRFWTERVRGRTIFYVLFVGLKPPTDTHYKTALVYAGTYTRGKNEAVYYGDFFKKRYLVKDENSLFEREGIDNYLQYHDFRYSGGFWFKAPVQ